jgi:hypothetical protein
MLKNPNPQEHASMSMFASSADYWRAQAEANAKDAERYRWLRDNASCQWDLDYEHVEVVFRLDEEEWEDMDDAIDRAMAAAPAAGAA